MADRGHRVDVLAAHPHYPEPRWGTRLLPYSEVRDGIHVRRLPIWPGRGSAAQRIRQELSFVAALSTYLPFAGKPDAVVAVSPSFPALGPMRAFARARRIPWVLWLEDILPDGATVSGVLNEGALVNAARRFERRAYRSADAIVVISDSFRENLAGKGVDLGKVARIYNPASRPVRAEPRPSTGVDPRAVLNMGNIGHTQNLAAVTRAFEADPDLAALGATLTMAGDGLAGDEVRKVISTDRVEVTGVLGKEPLEELLMSAAVGLVSQDYDAIDFNVPSKLMNFMAYGIPVVAAVRPDSEVARVVERAGAGWVTESPEECAAILAEVLPNAQERESRGAAGLVFAQREFAPERVAEQFESVLGRVVR
jgi:colanic acid biosynthesis glycosyl transferase WcaI